MEPTILKVTRKDAENDAKDEEKVDDLACNEHNSARLLLRVRRTDSCACKGEPGYILGVIEDQNEKECDDWAQELIQSGPVVNVEASGQTRVSSNFQIVENIENQKVGDKDSVKKAKENFRTFVVTQTDKNELLEAARVLGGSFRPIKG